MHSTREEKKSEKSTSYYQETKKELTNIDKKIATTAAKKNHYYVKFSFIEEIFILAHVGGGAILSIPSKPEILEALPKDVKANTNVNKIKVDRSKTQFDNYYDCGEMDIRDVKRALNLFMLRYQSDVTEPLISKNNPLLLQFEKALNKAKLKPIGLFSESGKSKAEVECLEPLSPANHDREELIGRILC